MKSHGSTSAKITRTILSATLEIVIWSCKDFATKFEGQSPVARQKNLRIGNGFTVLLQEATGRQCICEISRSSNLFPDASCARTQCGCLPRPDQVSEGHSGLRYFGRTVG